MEQKVEFVRKYSDMAIEYVVRYGLRVLVALVIIVVGFKVAQWSAQVFAQVCRKRHLDVTLTEFFSGIVRVVVIVFFALVALDKLGLTITPFVAALSALVFGASFAIQAPLSNYGAGLSLILTRPFKVGDTITIQGVSGVVEHIKLACTELLSADGEHVTIPNKQVVGEVLVNSHGRLVVEGSIGISYGDDAKAAAELVRRTIAAVDGVVPSPAAAAGVHKFGDSAVEIGWRYWAVTGRYTATRYAANLAIYEALKSGGYSIPYPQREVRVTQTPSKN